MTPTETIDQALKQGFLVYGWHDRTEIFGQFIAHHRAQGTPVATFRLMKSGCSGALRIGFPRRQPPSPDCQKEILQHAVWASDSRTTVDCCRHELFVSFLRSDQVSSVVEDVLDAWRGDQQQGAGNGDD